MSDAGFVPAESTFAGPAPEREVDTLEQLLGDLLAGRADVLALPGHKRRSRYVVAGAKAELTEIRTDRGATRTVDRGLRHGVLVERVGSLTAATPGTNLTSVVAGERVGLEPRVLGAVLEDVGDANVRVVDPLDPALDQFEVGVVAQAEAVETLGLGLGDVAGRGAALRVGVLVVADERLPVLVARPFDRVSDVSPGECHGPQSLPARASGASCERQTRGSSPSGVRLTALSVC